MSAATGQNLASNGAAHQLAGAARLVAAVVLVVAAIAATLPIWADLFEYAARNEEQSHSFVAMVVAAWLVWVARAGLRGVGPQWGLAGPVIMAAGWMLSAAGF